MPYAGVFIYIAVLATVATIACLALVIFVITSERRDKKDMREWRDKASQGKHTSAEPKKKAVEQKKPRPDPDPKEEEPATLTPKKEEFVDPIKTDTTETAKMPTVSTGATAYVPPESDQKDVSAATHRSNDTEVVTQPVLNPVVKPVAKKTAARKRAAKKVLPPKQPDA